MKRLIALFLFLASGTAALAQTDLRAVYNFASDSPVASINIESWSVDNWGDSFLSGGFNVKAEPVSLTSGYLDFARNFNFWHNVPVLKDFSLQAEFNGRVYLDNFNALFGVSYTVPLKKDVLRASVLFKTFNGGASSPFPIQLTILWRLYDLFGVRGLDFRGTARGWGENITYWYGDTKHTGDIGEFIILVQPQLWYAVGQFIGAENLSIGAEVELSYNWLGCRGFHVRPSAGLKLQF